MSEDSGSQGISSPHHTVCGGGQHGEGTQKQLLPQLLGKFMLAKEDAAPLIPSGRLFMACLLLGVAFCIIH